MIFANDGLSCRIFADDFFVEGKNEPATVEIGSDFGLRAGHALAVFEGTGAIDANGTPRFDGRAIGRGAAGLAVFVMQGAIPAFVG